MKAVLVTTYLIGMYLNNVEMFYETMDNPAKRGISKVFVSRFHHFLQAIKALTESRGV
jgi:hypothetical protein